ncbi:U1 small nuclear ribonucleoprotein C-like [Artibeus jamaicensis]|uniref:U1 small nuclear ribonucleoprotein C-like n=1 Tax=Artibeus jamaicensis TaxID=9417 RepID=UPI00235A7C65|nr:U1 small nuclear ribonucleoprotein C-like [Artibeus jamaicensis]
MTAAAATLAPSMKEREKGGRSLWLSGPWNNLPGFYCDFCDSDPTQDSPSARRTRCGGRTCRENVKGYSQKWMEEQAQSLIVETSAALQQGQLPPAPFSASPPAVAMIPPPPGMMPAPHTKPPPTMPMMGPPPGMLPVGPAPGMKPPTRGHMPWMLGNPVMRPPARPVEVPTRPGVTQSDR